MSEEQSKTQRIELVVSMMDDLKKRVENLQIHQNESQGFRERMDERTLTTNTLLKEIKEDMRNSITLTNEDVEKLDERVKDLEDASAQNKGQWKGLVAASSVGAIGGGGIVAGVIKFFSQFKGS